MDAIYSRWLGGSLQWVPERGMGYFPVSEAPYDAEYFAKYRGYADTPMGRAITQARIDLVGRHYSGPLLDVGIGSGQFVEGRPLTFGYDVNPAGVEWLKARKLYLDLYAGSVPAASFWDALEHIPNPSRALAHVSSWVFVSLPIFEDDKHVLRSKHYRRDEHVWYWSAEGLVRWMRECGFELREANQMESALGREDIWSYAFQRVAPCG